MDRPPWPAKREPLISTLLGSEIQSWPYSEDSLQLALGLQVEQERSKQEYYKMERLRHSLDLLREAIKYKVPANQIPAFYQQSAADDPPARPQSSHKYRYNAESRSVYSTPSGSVVGAAQTPQPQPPPPPNQPLTQPPQPPAFSPSLSEPTIQHPPAYSHSQSLPAYRFPAVSAVPDSAPTPESPSSPSLQFHVWEPKKKSVLREARSDSDDETSKSRKGSKDSVVSSGNNGTTGSSAGGTVASSVGSTVVSSGVSSVSSAKVGKPASRRSVHHKRNSEVFIREQQRTWERESLPRDPRDTSETPTGGPPTETESEESAPQYHNKAALTFMISRD